MMSTVLHVDSKRVRVKVRDYPKPDPFCCLEVESNGESVSLFLESPAHLEALHRKIGEQIDKLEKESNNE